ncbi:GatB/YqeY domain-containing protein [Candidatus Uhrbacteria bacterium]|nr:GatB/YqeY domain-containing protein [Candidatus Uhrbacteria bacterium]
MTLQEQLKTRLIAAMKEGKKDVVEALRGLQAMLKNKQIELQRELKDSEVIDVLKTASKQLKDAMTDFVKAEREDLIQKTKNELDLIAEFLPTPLERAEIRKHVVKLASDVGATTMKDMGKLMGAVMKALGAVAEGDDVRKEVEEFLSEKSDKKE